MLWRLLADATVALHLGFVLFVVLGGALVWRWPKLALLHVPAAVWGVWIEWSGGICPLTPLENALRARGAEPGYGGDFVAHYLLPVLYPAELTRELQWLLGALVLAVNAAFYLLMLRCRRPMR